MTLLMTFALLAAGVALLISTTRKVSRRYVASYAILVVLLSGFVSLMTFVTSSEGQFPLLDYTPQKTGADAFSGMMSRSMTYGMKGYGGGMVGMLLAWPLWKFFGAGLGAVILGLLMAVDVLVGGWSLFRRLYGWTGEKLVQLREKQAKRAEETAAEEARRQSVDLPGTAGSGETGAAQCRLLLDEADLKRGRASCDPISRFKAYLCHPRPHQRRGRQDPLGHPGAHPGVLHAGHLHAYHQRYAERRG